MIMSGWSFNSFSFGLSSVLLPAFGDGYVSLHYLATEATFCLYVVFHSRACVSYGVSASGMLGLHVLTNNNNNQD